jgi:hypothetical protein
MDADLVCGVDGTLPVLLLQVARGHVRVDFLDDLVDLVRGISAFPLDA